MNALQHKLQGIRRDLHSAWQQRTPREQQLLSAAAGILVLALLWGVAIKPALVTWREAPARQSALDTQTSHMLQLQAQVQALKKPSAITRAEALRWLEANIPQSLGKDAKWSLQGEQLSVTLSGATATQLTTWLGQARELAQALPVQAQLQQTPSPTDKSKPAGPADNTVRWSGSLLLSLP